MLRRYVNFPTRGIGARTLEQLQDVARQSGRSLWQSVGAVPGKGGANLQAFNALVDAMREATRGLTLREIIEHMLGASGLRDFYRAEREGPSGSRTSTNSSTRPRPSSRRRA